MSGSLTTRFQFTTSNETLGIQDCPKSIWIARLSLWFIMIRLLVSQHSWPLFKKIQSNKKIPVMKMISLTLLKTWIVRATSPNIMINHWTPSFWYRQRETSWMIYIRQWRELKHLLLYSWHKIKAKNRMKMNWKKNSERFKKWMRRCFRRFKMSPISLKSYRTIRKLLNQRNSQVAFIS